MSSYYIGILLFALIIAALFSRFIYPKKGGSTAKTAIVMLIMTAIVLGLRFATLAQDNPIDKADHALQSIPFYQTLKQRDPGRYQAVLAQVTHMAQQTGADSDAVLAQGVTMGQELIGPMLGAYVPKTSDKALWQFTSNMHNALKTLRKKDPRLCYQFLFPNPKNWQNLAGQRETILGISKQILPVMNQILIDYDASRSVPDESAVQQTLSDVFAELQMRHGDALALLNAPEQISDPTQQAQLCDITTDLYGTLLERHDDDAANSLRFMLSNE